MANASGKNLTRGASVMVIMITITKILGIVWIIPLTRLIHDEGIGIYSNAYSLYVFILTLSTSGFPTAMAKLIAERLAGHKYAEVEQIYKVTMRVVLTLGVTLSILMWFGAPLFSTLVALKQSAAAQQDMTLSIRALVPAVLLVPVMSALRGYLQGFQKLEPNAYSQAVEQLFRVVAMVVGTWYVIHIGGSVVEGAATATFGAFVGALAGLILLIGAVVPLRKSFARRVRTHHRTQLNSKQVFRLLMQYALPVCLGSLVVPISGMVDSLTVINLLMWSGDTYQQATSMYGVYSRQAMQLIQLPLAFAMALGVSILPAIAEASAQRNQKAINLRIETTYRSTLFMTLPVAATLLVLGAPIDQILSGSTEGAAIISSVCFMGVFSGLELISTYMLQGLGKMYRPVRNMFIGILFKLILNMILVLMFHAIGAAIASTLGYLLSSTLNVLAVRKYGRTTFSLGRVWTPLLLASLVCAVVLWLASTVTRLILSPVHLPADAVAVFQVVVAVALGGLVYVLGALRLRAVTPDELQRIPGVGRRLAPIAKRMQQRRTA